MTTPKRIDVDLLDTMWTVFMVIVFGAGFMTIVALLITELETYRSIQNHL
jgi:hypothetical protein